MILLLLVIAGLMGLFIGVSIFFARRRRQKYDDPQLEEINRKLHARTLEGAALREHGLRRLEELLLAKTDWRSPEERAKTMTEFYLLAARLRKFDADLAEKRNRKQGEPS
jgi:hypothetical protein